MGSDSSPFRFSNTTIWSHETYSVNRFMITNTWWAQHCTHPSIMLVVWQGLTVTIVIMWQLLIYYLVPQDCDGSSAIPLAAISDLRNRLCDDKCPLSERYTQQNVTLESSALNANWQLWLPPRIWKSYSKAMKKGDLCPLTHGFFPLGTVIFRDATQWIVKQCETENEAINSAEASTLITEAGMHLSNYRGIPWCGTKCSVCLESYHYRLINYVISSELIDTVNAFTRNPEKSISGNHLTVGYPFANTS